MNTDNLFIIFRSGYKMPRKKRNRLSSSSDIQKNKRRVKEKSAIVPIQEVTITVNHCKLKIVNSESSEDRNEDKLDSGQYY